MSLTEEFSRRRLAAQTSCKLLSSDLFVYSSYWKYANLKGKELTELAPAGRQHWKMHIVRACGTVVQLRDRLYRNTGHVSRSDWSHWTVAVVQGEAMWLYFFWIISLSCTNNSQVRNEETSSSWLCSSVKHTGRLKLPSDCLFTTGDKVITPNTFLILHPNYSHTTYKVCSLLVGSVLCLTHTHTPHLATPFLLMFLSPNVWSVDFILNSLFFKQPKDTTRLSCGCFLTSGAVL